MTERWLPIPGYEGRYEISDQGRVKSLPRRTVKSNGVPLTVTEKIMKGWLVKGYPTVALRRDGVTVTRQVHRLVLAAFVGPCPDGMEGCHNDGDPANNRLTNLRWDSSSENKRDTVRHGNHYSSRKTHCPLGHPLAHPNLIRSALRLGTRQCRACNQGRSAVALHGGDLKQISDVKYARIMEKVA